MGFYFIWNFFTLYHIKENSSPSEAEIIDLKLRRHFSGAITITLFTVGFIMIILMIISLIIIFASLTYGLSLILLLPLIFIIIKKRSLIKSHPVMGFIKKIIKWISIATGIILWITLMTDLSVFVAATFFFIGLVYFIKNFIYLFKMSSMSWYSLRARYIAIHVIIIILMVWSYNMCINYFPG